MGMSCGCSWGGLAAGGRSVGQEQGHFPAWGRNKGISQSGAGAGAFSSTGQEQGHFHGSKEVQGPCWGFLMVCTGQTIPALSAGQTHKHCVRQTLS